MLKTYFSNRFILAWPILPNAKRFLDIFSIVILLSLASHGQSRLLQEHKLAEVEGVTIYSWTYTSDGLRVKGELYLPPSKERLPLVLFNHDGISGISREHRLSAVRIARAGYVVFCPSYRGEDGSEGIVEIAKGEVQDVLNSLPLLKSLKQVDPQRIAIAGASHGALISILAASQVKDFKAIVSAYGVMDIYSWYSYLKRTDQLGGDPITSRTYGKGPEKRPQSFKIRNALGAIPKLSAPVLLLQGAKDTIVPLAQAEIMARRLKEAGKAFQIKVYPDALHGFLVYAPYLKDASPAEKAQTEEAWLTTLAFLKKNLSN